MSTKLEQIQLLFQKRNARKRGPTSSDQYNDMIDEISNDLTTLNSQWNNRLIPLTDAIPDGTVDATVDAYTNGLDGGNLYVDQDASATANAIYFNSPSSRPNTILEQLDAFYTTMNEIRDDLEAQITGTVLTAAQISIVDSNGIYVASNVELALAEVMNKINLVGLLTFGSVGEDILPSTDNAFDVGSSTKRWNEGYFYQLRMADGDATLPSFSFADDTDSGMYKQAANSIAFAANGIERLRINTSGLLVSSGVIRNAIGTANNPTYTFNGDTDTGMYHVAANSLGFSTLGTNKLTIASSGNVGIGTTNPANLLHLSSAVPDIRLTDTDTSGYALISANSSVGGLNIYADQGNTVANSYMAFSVDASEKVRIDSNGNVGIGTASPGNKLDLLTGSTTDSAVHIGEIDNEGIYITSLNQWDGSWSVGAEYVAGSWTARATQAGVMTVGSGHFNFYTDESLTNGVTYTPTSRMTIRREGNVGVNKTDPESRFHVLEDTALGSMSGDTQLLTTVQGNPGNSFRNRVWLRRDAAGSNWTTARLHDAISVDSVYGIPGTDTRCWIERDPNTQEFRLGSGVDQYLYIGPNILNFQTNEDKYAEFGRAWIGYNGTSSDVAAFGHYDRRTSTGYAIKQADDGTTRLNSATGRNTYLCTNNTDCWYVDGITGNFRASGTRQILADDASSDQNAPAYSFNGDTDTGMYQVSSNTIGLATAGTLRMTLFSGGNVTIGASESVGKLSVIDYGADIGSTIQTHVNNANDAHLSLRKARGGTSTKSIISPSDDLGTIDFWGYDGSNFVEAGKIQVTSNGTPATNDIGADMVFSINTGGASATDKMWLTKDSYLGIGSYPDYALDVYAFQKVYAARIRNWGGNTSYRGLHIRAGESTPSGTNYFISMFSSTGTNECGVNRSGTGSPAFYNVSDKRVKENIAPTSVVGLNIINNLELYEFHKTRSIVGGNRDPSVSLTDIGFIAQQAAPIYPKMVDRDQETDTMNVSEGVLIPVMVKAIQELSTKLEAALARIEELEKGDN